MSDIAVLGFKVESDQLRKAAMEMDDLTRAADKTERGVKDAGRGMERSFARAGQSIDRDLNRAEDALEDLERQARASAQGVSASGRAMAGSMAQAGAMSSNLRQLSFQMSQVAQQASAGGGFLRALAIQAPDIAMFLPGGALTVGIGTVTGLLLGMAPAFFGAGEAAEDAGDAVKSLTSALDSYESFASTAGASTADLRQEYGAFAEDVRRHAEMMANLSLIDAQGQLRAAIDPMEQQFNELLALFEEVERRRAEVTEFRPLAEQGLIDLGPSLQVLELYEGMLADLSGEMGLSADQAGELAFALNAVGASKGPDQIREAASNALDVIASMSSESETFSKTVFEIASGLWNIHDSAAAAALAQKELTAEAGNTAEAMSDANKARGEYARSLMSSGAFQQLKAEAEAAEQLEASLARVNAVAGRAGGGLGFRLQDAEQLKNTYGAMTEEVRQQLILQQQIAAVEARRDFQATARAVMDATTQLDMSAEAAARVQAALGGVLTAQTDIGRSQAMFALNEALAAAGGSLDTMSAEFLQLLSATSASGAEMAQLAETMRVLGVSQIDVSGITTMESALKAADTTAQEFGAQLQQLGHDVSQAGVKAFQESQGIVADGIVGPQTLAAMEQALAAAETAKAASVEAEAAAQSQAQAAATAADAAGQVGEAAATAASEVETQMDRTLAAVSGAVDQGAAAGQDVGAAISGGMAAGAAEAQSEVLNSVMGAINAVSGLSGQGYVAGRLVGQQIMAGLAGGITSGAVEAANRAQAAVNAVVQSARAAADIRSPSRVFDEIGQYMMQGLAQGIDGGAPLAESSVRDVANRVAATLEDEAKEAFLQDYSYIAKHWGLIGADAMDAIAKAINANAGEVESALVSAVEQAQSAAEDKLQEFRDIGGDFAAGLLDGMREGDLPGFFEDFMSDARGSFDSLLKSVLDGSQTFGQAIGGAFNNVTQGFQLMGSGNFLGGFGQALSGIMPILGGISTAINLISSFSSTTLLDSGYKGSIGAKNWLASFEKTRRTSWWGLRSNTSEDLNQTGMAPQLREASILQRRELEDELATLGLGSRRLDKISLDFKFSAGRGMSSQEVEDEILRQFEALRDVRVSAYAKELEEFRQLGERPSETLTRLSSNLVLFNDSMRVLGMDTLPKSIASAVEASKALKKVGGEAEYLTGYNAYLSGILSPEDQAKAAGRDFRQTAKELGIDPGGFKTAEDLQTAIERAQANGKTGRATSLISLADEFVAWIDLKEAIQDNTKAQTDANLQRSNFSTVAGYERAVRQSEAGRAWAYDWGAVSIPGGNQGARDAVTRELITMMKDQSENGMVSIRLLRKLVKLSEEGNQQLAGAF